MIESIIISPDIKEAKIGQTIDFSYKIFPTELEVPVSFSSDNEDIMLVRNQTLTFLNKGVVHLIITAEDYSNYITIVVGEAEDNLSSLYAMLEKALYQLELELESKLKICDADLRQELGVYQNSIRKDVIELKNALLNDYEKIKNQYNEEVKSEFNLSILTFKEKLKEQLSIFNEQIATDSNKAFEILANLKQEGNTFLNDLNKRLEIKRNDFFISIETVSNQQKQKFIDSVDSKLSELQNKVQEYVRQIDSSSEYAVNYIYKAMNTAIDNIESAEATVLKNITILKDQVIDEIKKTVDDIDIIIADSIAKAVQEILEIKDSAISEIKKNEIIVKNAIDLALQGAIGQLDSKLNDLYGKLEDKEALLEAKLEDKKTEILDSFEGIVDEAVFEFEKVKNKLINEFTQEVSVFFNALIKKEQEIIAKIIAVVEGYDLELQTIIDAKVRWFKDHLDLIAQNYVVELKDLLLAYTEAQIIRIGEVKDDALARIGLEDTSMYGDQPSARKDAIDSIENKKNEVVDSLLDLSTEEIRKFIATISVQKYVKVLKAGETLIDISESKFVITNRLKLYIDGILQIEGKQYTVNVFEKTITLSKPYKHNVDVLITEDFPDNDIGAQIESGLSNLQQKTEESLKEIDDFKNLSIDEIINKLPEWIEETKTEIDKISKIYKEEFKKYVEQWTENIYSISIEKNQNSIVVPPLELVLNKYAKVYFDGILQTLNTHYTVDFLTNSITILHPFEYPIDVLITQNLPVTSLPKREATDKEIDDLFLDSYRLGTNKDIDSLYKMKAATDKDVDSLF